VTTERPLLELKWLDPADVEANPRNWREHPPSQAHALSSSLDTVGWAGAALFNKRTGRLVDGHLRQKQAKDRGELLPVLVGEWSEAQEAYILATLDPIAAAARVNETALDNLLAEIGAAVKSGDLTADLGHLDDLLRDLQRTPAPPTSGLLPDADPDKIPETAPARCEAGDLWALGEHRLLCGDSTRAEDVARLMDGEHAEVLWTDPPYGVSYVGKTAAALTIENDEAADIPDLLQRAFAAADAVMAPGARVYLAAPAGPLNLTFRLCFQSAGWRFHEGLVWVKSAMVLGHSDYHLMHEDILYGWKPGEGRVGRGNHPGTRWYGDHAQTSVFQVDKPSRSAEHPTMKPVALITPMLENSSKPGDVVLDSFGGSGSTLMACEEIGRKARLAEVALEYCDVILARYEAATGKTATILSRVNEPAVA
jgi:DNA modification methylase